MLRKYQLVAGYNSCFHLVMKGILVHALLLLIKLLKKILNFVTPLRFKLYISKNVLFRWYLL